MSANRAAVPPIALAVACAIAFLASPRREAGDGNYALLTSESLARGASFDLDRVVPPTQLEGPSPGRVMGPLHLVDGHVRLAAAPGTALFSIPFVPLIERAPPGPPLMREAWAGHLAASLLMGALAGVLFLLARLFVGPGASALIACAAGFGTPIWSVASRGLWSHTWTVLLLGIALCLVARSETAGARPRPVAVAALLFAAYLTRPDAVGAMLPLAVHVAREPRQRKWFLAGAAFSIMAIAGVAWLQAGALLVWPGLGVGVAPDRVPANLLAQLVSPSRGFLWFVPTSAFVAYLLIRYRTGHASLVRLGLVTIAVHTLLQAWNHQWYGGFSYGPRLLVELVPFLALLAALGLAARRDARVRGGASARRTHQGEALWGALLLVMALGIHARGAWSRRVWQWNSSPTLVDADPARVWDWREPQMLAGLVASLRPVLFPVWQAGDTVEPGSPHAASFFGIGWDAPEGDFRWALGPEAELFFRRAGRPGPLLLRILGFSHEHPGGAPQRLEVALNGRPVGTLDIGSGPESWRTIVLEARAQQTLNVVRLGFPDAASPRALGQGDDERPLGFAVRSLRLDRFPALPSGGTLRMERADDSLGPGWGPAEGGWRPIEKPEAWLWFADPPADAALLRMEIASSGPTASILRVHLNGIELDAMPVPTAENVTRAVVVPRGALGADNVLRLVRTAESAITVASIALAGMPAYADDQGIRPANPGHDAYLLAGWSPRETDGSPYRWTEGREARVVFAVDDPGRYRVVRLRLGAFLQKGLDAQRLQVALNGHALAPLVLRNTPPDEFPLALPRGLLDARNVLALSLPDARSPASLRTGNDTRALGVAVESIRLTK